ncbi:hypothetical protein [Sphingomonas sp. SFZ2018-12]|nr:hypothetical protein [Sphingomonas sp. SFZ2018-12]
MLAGLASAPTPAALDALDERVFADLLARAAHPGPSIAAFGSGAAMVALAVGVATAQLSIAPQAKAPELAALSSPTAYAPSTLLGQ